MFAQKKKKKNLIQFLISNDRLKDLVVGVKRDSSAKNTNYVIIN